MREPKTQDELLQSYIETETVATARPFHPNDVKLSRLIRDYYNDKKLHEEPVANKSNTNSASYDALTGLISPPVMVALLEKYLQLAKEKETFLAILYLELDGLTQVNKSYGRAVADQLVNIVANRLKKVVRKSDLLSYLYGNKFLVGLMVEKQDLKKIELLSEKIKTVISEPIKIGSSRLEVRGDISIVAYPVHGDKVSVLLDIAKMKMYRVREAEF